MTLLPKKQLHHNTKHTKKPINTQGQKGVTDFMLPLRCFVFFFPLGLLEQSNLGGELCQLSSLPGEKKKTQNNSFTMTPVSVFAISSDRICKVISDKRLARTDEWFLP